MKQMICTKKWYIANDQLNADYHVGNEIIYNSSIYYL